MEVDGSGIPCLHLSSRIHKTRIGEFVPSFAESSGARLRSSVGCPAAFILVPVGI